MNNKISMSKPCEPPNNIWASEALGKLQRGRISYGETYIWAMASSLGHGDYIVQAEDFQAKMGNGILTVRFIP
jgi:hypothetical protein